MRLNISASGTDAPVSILKWFVLPHEDTLPEFPGSILFVFLESLCFLQAYDVPPCFYGIIIHRKWWLPQATESNIHKTQLVL